MEFTDFLCTVEPASSGETVSTEVSSDIESGDEDSCSSSSPLLVEKPSIARSWSDFFLEPRVSRGRHSIPLQLESRSWLKHLIWIPLSALWSMAFSSYVWLPWLSKQGAVSFMENLFWTMLQNRLILFVLVFTIFVGIIWDISTEVWTFVMLLRGKRERHLPDHIPRLVHAVIVCNYKEPVEVLQATIASIAENTLATSTIVILACEARDSTAADIFATLQEEFQDCFRSFVKTSHELAPGEIVGKSSNENHACRELYKMVQKEGIDPFKVMVTTCDADSLFDGVFLEQVEAEFCRQPDGRRFIYNSPINTYRNIPECNPLVKTFEIRRNQFDLFCGQSFRPAQSNYSLTLGFAKEINYWDPSNTSEDFHTTLKAMAMTGKGTDVVVRVWSLILNDSVTSLKDRWVQAKRHMWGIEELPFVISLFPVLRMNLWTGLFGRVSSQMFGVCVPAMVLVCFAPVRELFYSLREETQHLIVAVFLARIIYDWAVSLLREIFLYKLIIGDRKLMMKRTVGEWVQIFLVWPIIAQLSTLLFATLATWRVLVHALFHDTLAYVTAPKAMYSVPSTIETTNEPPKKSV